MGARDGSQRTQAQTDTARFWEATLPPLYHGLARELARQPGRELRQNARFFARLTCAMDDALIAVFDAKYHYRLWRPITAIRNGDRDGNDATPRDARWLPLIETPMHPEYPCAHCAVSAAVATVLEAEARDSGFSHWTTTSTTAGGALVMGAFAVGSMPALAVAPWAWARWRAVRGGPSLSAAQVATRGFRIAGFGIGNMVQSNSIAEVLKGSFGISPDRKSVV